MKNTIELSSIKNEDIMAFTYFAKVKKTNGKTVFAQDLDNPSNEFSVNGKELLEGSMSADFFSETEKVNKTRLAELLTYAGCSPFTVCFDKTDGSERILRGRMIAPEPLLGRSKVEDLDVDGKHRMRLVDHRTLKWLIVDCVKYVVK